MFGPELLTGRRKRDDFHNKKQNKNNTICYKNSFQSSSRMESSGRIARRIRARKKQRRFNSMTAEILEQDKCIEQKGSKRGDHGNNKEGANGSMNCNTSGRNALRVTCVRTYPREEDSSVYVLFVGFCNIPEYVWEDL